MLANVLEDFVRIRKVMKHEDRDVIKSRARGRLCGAGYYKIASSMSQ